MKKTAFLVSLFVGLAALAGCQSAANPTPPPSSVIVASPPAQTPSPTVTPAPEEPSLFFYSRSDGKNGILRSDGAFAIPCQYENIFQLYPLTDRFVAGRVLSPQEDEKNPQILYALLDQNGQPMTEFCYNGLYLISGQSDFLTGWREESSTRAILDVRTGETLLELPSSGWNISVSGLEDLLICYDPEANSASLYELTSLREGVTEPVSVLENVESIEAVNGWEGIFAVRRSWEDCVFYDRNGPLLGGASFEGFSFQAGEGLLTVRKNGLHGCIDTDGNWVIEPVFGDIYPFSNGLAAAWKEDGLWGYIDKSGQWVIEPQFTSADTFCNGYAICTTTEYNADGSEKQVLLNSLGDVLLSGRISGYWEDGDFPMVCVESEGVRTYYSLSRDGSSAPLLLKALGEEDASYWQNGTSGSYAIIAGWKDSGDTPCGILNMETGNWVLEPGKYQQITLPRANITENSDGYFPEDSPVLCAYYRYHNTTLINLIDWDGNVLLERLNQVDGCDGKLILVQKGFSKGLMDLSGSWIYQESIFSVFDDE